MLNNKKYIIIALGFSLLFHLLFIFNAGRIHFDSLTGRLIINHEIKMKDMKVEVVDTDVLKKIMERQNTTTDTAKELQQKLEQQKISAILKEQNLLPKPKLDFQMPKIESNKFEDLEELKVPQAEILTVDTSKLSAEDRQDMHEVSLVGREIMTENMPSLLDIGKQSVQKSFSNDVVEMIEKRNPSLPEMPPEPSIETILPEIPIIDTTGNTVESFDDTVVVNMQKFPDSKGGGFYRLDIHPTLQIDRLKEVAKDVIFLVDCSGSISVSKFRQFREGVIQSIDFLNATDRMNIVTFAETPRPLFANYVFPTVENKEKAKKMMRQVRQGGMTDVFQSLSPYIANAQTERPLLIFMLTDGVTTVSRKYTTEKFIQEIVKMNKNNVAIYSFSAGKGVDLTLINFLAYHNRGLTKHETQEKNFSSMFSQFVNQNTDLVIANLKLMTQGHFSKEIYPKNLPHLFRKNTYSVWGRYEAEDKEVLVSITGIDAQGKKMELIFKKDFASATLGDDSIKELWALQKLFYLRGQMILDEKNKSKYEKEVNQLMFEFNIKRMPF